MQTSKKLMEGLEMKKVLVFVSALIFVSACGGGGADVTTADQLPKMTSPVISGATLSSVKVDTATTGLAYWGATAASFPQGSSRSECESFNTTREILDRAAQGDKTLCYVQNTIVTAANKAALGSVDPYDGSYHIVDLTGITDQDGNLVAAKMKLKITKSGSSITGFEMFMCMNGTSQTEYLNQTISGSDITIVSKNIQNQGGGETWKASINVVGKLDGVQFTQKQMTGISSWTSTQNTNSAKVIIDQYADALIASAYQTGTYNDGVNDNAYSTQAYAKYELLNGTSADLHTWAVGDGSVKVKTSNTWNGTQNDNPEGVISWLGDTKADTTATSGMFYSSVNAGTLPTTNPSTEAGAIAFAASETWDCAGTAEATLTVDQAALDVTCDKYGFRPNNSDSWIDCCHATGECH
jgi:hypothetical protein